MEWKDLCKVGESWILVRRSLCLYNGEEAVDKVCEVWRVKVLNYALNYFTTLISGDEQTKSIFYTLWADLGHGRYIII